VPKEGSCEKEEGSPTGVDYPGTSAMKMKDDVLHAPVKPGEADAMRMK
jgi:hypothetical protein